MVTNEGRGWKGSDLGLTRSIGDSQTAKSVLWVTRALETDGTAGCKAKQVHLAPQTWTLADARVKWLYHRGKNSGAICPRLPAARKST